MIFSGGIRTPCPNSGSVHGLHCLREGQKGDTYFEMTSCDSSLIELIKLNRLVSNVKESTIGLKDQMVWLLVVLLV